MKKINYISIFLILFIGFLFSSSADAAKRYKYVCDNEDCYNTERNYIGENFYINKSDGSFEKNEVINFTDEIDKKIDNYIDYYGNDIFIIDNFCDGDCEDDNDLFDKSFTFEELIDTNENIHIGNWHWFTPPTIDKTYSNGKDYLFANFGIVIDELHSNGFPLGDKKNQLSDLVGNIIEYSDLSNEFNLRNVCNRETCPLSEEKILEYGDSDSFFYVSGNVKQSIFFTGDTFKVSDTNYIYEEGTNFEAVLIKGGETIDFEFSFEDYLDFTEDETEYRYVISYFDDGVEPLPSNSQQQLLENITIDNDTFEVIESGLGDNLDDVIDIIPLDTESRKIKVIIKESFNIPLDGDKSFYLQADNLTSGDTFPITKINSFPLEVIHNDNIVKSTGIINGFTLEENNDIDIDGNPGGYGKDKPFKVIYNLYDDNGLGNNHFDQIDGYEVTISDGTSNKIEISKDGTENSFWGKTLTGITTNDNKEAIFYFRATEPGYHELNGFNFKVREKNDSTNYSTILKYYELINQVPANLIDNGTKQKINIKTPLYDVIPISCSSNVIINFECKSDNLSGCYISYENDETYKQQISKSFSSEDDNEKHIELSIRDKAYNWRTYSGTLNHVDTSEPGIEIIKNGSVLSGGTHKYLSNSDDLVLRFNEITTENCEDDLFYNLKLNNSFYMSGVLDFNSSEINIPGFFTGAIVDKKLDIEIKDSYGNINTDSISFDIFPNNNIEFSDFDIISSSNSKYANNSDEYLYSFKLIDEYGNKIYGKDLIEVIQSNDGTTGDFYSLRLNENNNNSIDEENLSNEGLSTALITEYSGTSSLDGEFYFSLKSLTPGIFTEKFNIRLNKWLNDYTDINESQLINIGSMNNTNSFLKPLSANISIDGLTDIPAINTNYKFNIGLTNDGNLNNISDGELVINRNSILPKSDGHNWEDNSFKVIGNGDFSLTNMVPSFSGTIEADSNFGGAIDIGFNDLKVIYKIGGKFVSYFLDQFDLENGCEVETLGVKIYGTLEGEGKANQVGQVDNFSSITKSEIRGKIRKNAFMLIRGREPSKVQNINGVIYSEGDTFYSEIKDNINFNDTIIVKDGNFIIDEDILTNIGVIVLKSNYNVLSDYNTEGNIYINKNVSDINSILYSDGALRSANNLGYIYHDSELNSQLILNGSIFTRNTIGGSIGENTLPGGKIIESSSDFFLANIYDLNNIRKQVLECNGSNEDNYSFIIKYNSNIQLNPPKGFNVN